MSDLTQAELQLLKQISDSLGHLNERMTTQEGLSRQTLQQMAAMQERVANTAKLESKIEGLETRLSNRLNNHSDRLQAVEARGFKQDGAMSLVEWANKVWPICAAVIGVIGIYLGFSPS